MQVGSEGKSSRHYPVMHHTDTYTFTGSSFGRGVNLSQEEELSLHLLAPCSNFEQTRFRCARRQILRHRQICTDSNQSGSPRPSEIRAMRWRAEALSMSTDKPDKVIISRRSTQLLTRFLHRPDIQTWFLDEKLQALLNHQEYLTESQWLRIKKAVCNYAFWIVQRIAINRSRISNLEKDAVPFIAAKWEPIFDRAGLSILLQNRSIVCMLSRSSDFGFIRCGESTGIALAPLLSQPLHPYFVPVCCQMDLTGNGVSSDHMFIFLLNPREYKQASQGQAFEFHYNQLNPSLDSQLPAPWVRDLEQLFPDIAHGSQTQGNVQSPQAREEVDHKIPLDENSLGLNMLCVSANIDNAMSIPAYKKKTGPELIPPDIIKSYHVIMADPWIQNWQELNTQNWGRVLREIARECGIRSLKAYSLEYMLLF